MLERRSLTGARWALSEASSTRVEALRRNTGLSQTAAQVLALRWDGDSEREADQWLFTVEGEEELQLPGGALRALKLVRNPRKEFDQKVELWLAPGMDYVPVRLRLTQANGDWLEQQWSGTDRG